MITVVIPSYNKEKFISETIQSVIDQSFRNFEIIIVDDGSTDNSVSVINSIKDDRIQLISIENSGVSVARNTAIQKATYHWIAFLDADDWWDSNFLKEIAQAIKAYPQNSIFGTGRNRVFGNRTERYANDFLPKVETTGLVNYFKVISKDLPPINSSNVVISKSLLVEKGLFTEGMKQHEDHDLWLRVCETEEIVFVNKELSFYRKDIDDSASKSHFNTQDFERYLNTILKISDRLSLELNPFFQQYYQRFVVISYFQNCYGFSKQERVIIYRLSKKLKMSWKYKCMLWVTHTFSFINVYGLYKKLKG